MTSYNDGKPSVLSNYVRQTQRLAMGDHPLAKYVPPLLLVLDAVLTNLIISKVAC